MSLHEIVLPETKPYLSYADVAADAPHDAVQVPQRAPTVAVEILSLDDGRADVEDKIVTYLTAGAAAVIVVDPREQTIIVRDSASRTVRSGECLTHAALPGFSLDVADFFERARR